MNGQGLLLTASSVLRGYGIDTDNRTQVTGPTRFFNGYSSCLVSSNL